jgi:hypothetical protein
MKAIIPGNMNIWGTSFVIGSSAFVKNGTALYEFKPGQNQWLIRSQFPGVATGGCSSFVVDEKGYVVTGYAGGLSNVTKEVWQYNPATNNWLQMEDFPGTARRFSIGFSINNRGYFGSGTNGINFNDFWAYDHFLAQQELEKPSAFTIFPNPFVDEIHVKIGDEILEQPNTFQVFTADGKERYSTTFFTNEQRLQLDFLQAGTYYCVLKVGNKIVQTQTIIK